MPGQRRKISYHRELYVVRKRIARIMKGKGGGKRRVKRPHGVPIVDLSCCKYEILRIVLRKNGWEEAGDDEKNSHLIWTDMSIGPERLMTLKRGQKINHFFGMLGICRKKSLARTLSTMRKMFPSQYKFFPRSFILPNQLPELLSKFNFHKIKTFILKPDNGCQGRGVALAQSGTDVRAAIEGLSGSNLLAQKYLANPMLINGYKFDLRIYVLILSCDPLRLYLYREGIVRFCTEKYSKPDPKNLSLNCMHLTNYAVNKHNGKFEFNTNPDETDKGHKWTLTSLYSALASRGYDTSKLQRQISQLVVMTLIGIVPLLVHNSHAYLPEDDTGRTCFELLGMDVLLDENCKPWLLEVNHSPSFSIDTPLDLNVKEALLTDTLRLVHMDPSTISRLRMQERKGAICRLYGKVQSSGEHSPQLQAHSHMRKKDPFDEYEKANRGKYDCIYPPEDKNLMELYRIFLAGSEAAFKHSFHMRIKDTIVRVQEERKQEELAKEAEERKRVKARCEIRKKAQKSARLAALAARAKLVQKLTSEMQEELQSVVAATNFNDQVPLTPHEHSVAEVDAHLIEVVEPVEPSDWREISRCKESSSPSTKGNNLYGGMKGWRTGSTLCGAKGFPDAASEAVAEARTAAPKASDSTAESDGIWNEFFTKPLKDLDASRLLARTKYLEERYDAKKLPTAQLQKLQLSSNFGQHGISAESLALTQRYQGRLPALLPKGGAFIRANTLSLPASLAQLGSKYFPGKQTPHALHVQTQHSPNSCELIPSSITDIMRAQFGLPKIGDHPKWKPADHRQPRRVTISDLASGHQKPAGDAGSPAATSIASSVGRAVDSPSRFGDVTAEKRRLNSRVLCREKKAHSWLRSPN